MKSGFRRRGVSASALGAGALRAQEVETLFLAGLLCRRQELVHHATARPVAPAHNNLVSQSCRGSASFTGRWVDRFRHVQQAVILAALVRSAPATPEHISWPAAGSLFKSLRAVQDALCRLTVLALRGRRLPRRKARWTLGLPALLCCLLLACSASADAEHRRRRRYRAHSPTGDPQASGGALHYGGPAGDNAPEGGQR